VNDPLIKSNSQVPAANITHMQCVEGFLINYRCLNAASRKPDANKGNKNWGQNLSILGNFSEGYRAHKVSSNAPAKDTNYETITAVNAGNKSDPKPNRLANNGGVLHPARISRNTPYDHTLYAIQQLGSPKCFMRLFAEMLRKRVALFICLGARQFLSLFR